MGRKSRLLAILLVLCMALGLCACSGAKEEEKKDLSQEIKIAVQGKAAAKCMFSYKDVKNVLADVSSSDKQSDGSYAVKGYVTVIDAYGDRYKAKYDATVTVDDKGDAKCKTFKMDDPKKSK